MELTRVQRLHIEKLRSGSQSTFQGGECEKVQSDFLCFVIYNLFIVNPQLVMDFLS